MADNAASGGVNHVAAPLLVTLAGFEPALQEPESCVLPLHQRAEPL